MNYLLIILSIVAAGACGYVYGSLEPHTVHEPMMGYHERSCDVITRYADGSSICKIFARFDESDIRVFTKTIASDYAR